MTNRGFAIIFASVLLFLGQCGYSNSECSSDETKCDSSDLGTHEFLMRAPNATDGCYDDGSEVTLTCKHGKIDGSPSIMKTCSDGSWDDDTPSECTGYCTPPNADTVKLSSTEPAFEVGNILVFSCANGKRLTTDSPKSIVCTDGGTWNNDTIPVCEAFNCDALNIKTEHLNWTSPEADVYNGHETIEYSCSEGYTLKGSKDNTCVDDNKWENEHPTCSNTGNAVQMAWYILVMTTSYTLISFYM